jgi:hypothetical protein
MVQLKITPVTQGSPAFPTATGQQFGTGVGEAVQELGQQVSATGRIVENISRSRARATAARFDAALGAREETIKATTGPENFEEEFDKAKTELLDQFGQEPFIHKGQFNREAGLRVDQRLVGLRAHKNRLLVEQGVAATSENMRNHAEEFALAPDQVQRDVAMIKMGLEIEDAIENNLIFAEEGPAKLREAQYNGIVGAFNRLLNEDPLEAGLLAKEFVDELGVEASEKMFNQALKRSESDDKISISADLSADRARRAATTAKQLNNSEFLFSKARRTEPGVPGLTLADIREAVDADPDGTAISIEQETLLTNLVNRGGFVGTPFDAPGVFQLAQSYVDGTEPLPPGNDLATALSNLTLTGQLKTTTASSLLARGRTERSSTGERIIENAVKSLAPMSADGVVNAGKATAALNVWVLDHPNATETEIVNRAAAALEEFNVFGLLGAIPSTKQRHIKRDNRGDLLVEESKTALRRDWKESQDGTLAPSDYGFIDRAGYALALDAIIKEAAAQASRETVKVVK